MNKLDKRINVYYFIVRNILSLVIYAGFIGSLMLDETVYADPFLKWSFVIVTGILALLCAIGSMILPWFIHKMYGYKIHEDHIEIRTGVLFKSKDIVPIKRIQHVEKNQGPIQSLFKQASITFFTAGVGKAIRGLSQAEAENILYEIKRHLDHYLEHHGDDTNE